MYINDLDNITDFEFCEFHRTTETWIDRETFFFQRKNSFITHVGLLFIKE